MLSRGNSLAFLSEFLSHHYLARNGKKLDHPFALQKQYFLKIEEIFVLVTVPQHKQWWPQKYLLESIVQVQRSKEQK